MSRRTAKTLRFAPWHRNAGLPVPELIALIRTSGEARAFVRSLPDGPGFVVKPDSGAMGNGIRVVESLPDTEGTRRAMGHDILWLLLRILAGEFSGTHAPEPALVEERIVTDGQLRAASGHGAADLRVLCCRGGVLQAMLRLATRRSDGKANLHQGGVGVGIDLDTGQTTYAVCRGRSIRRHPDTDADLGGLGIPGWKDDIMPIVRHIASRCPLQYCGVDIMLDHKKGPVVVELNARPGLQIQLANRTPLKRAIRGLALILMAAVLLGATAVEADDDRETDVTASEQAEAEAVIDLAAAQKAVEQKPGDARALNDLAVAQHATGGVDIALDTLRRAIRLDPAYHRAPYNLGTFLLANEDYPGAEAALRRAVELQPFYTEAWFNLGVALSRERDPGMVDAFQRASALQPANAEYAASLGRSLQRLQRYPEAADAYARALESDGTDEKLASRHVYCLGKAGRYEEADKAYQRLTAAHPEDLTYVFNYAAMKSRSGDDAGAEVLYRRLLKKDPTYCKAWNNLAYVHMRAGQFDEAQACIDQIRSLDRNYPNLSSVIQNLARLVDAAP